MDRGSVVDHLVTEVSEIQICRYDLGDPGNPMLFITACEPSWRESAFDFVKESPGSYPHDLVNLADTPIERGAPDAEWPQFLTPEQLDEFIAKLQAQRAWLAETDPAKREEL